MLEGETATLNAVPEEGYTFVGWPYLGGGLIVSVDNPYQFGYSNTAITYVANFQGKSTSLKVEPSENGNVTKVKINGYDATPVDGIYSVKLGDTVWFEVKANTGYTHTKWSINGVQKSLFSTYKISVEDAEKPLLTFQPMFSVSTITYIIQYEQNMGTVEIDDKKINSGSSLITTYFDTINIKAFEKIRYQIDKVIINNYDYTQQYLVSTSYGYEIDIPSQLLSTTQRNTIQITFKMLYWLDSRQMFEGLGTASNPYKITSAEHFAMMCYLINNNIEVDAVNKTNYASAYYVLTVPVNFEKAFWVPIGTEENPFDGTMKFEYKRTNIVLDKDYPVTHYEGLFGYITEYAKFIDATKDYQIAITIICSFLGLIIIIVVIFVIIRATKRRKIERKRNMILMANGKKQESKKEKK